MQYANKMGYTVVALSSSADKKDFAAKLGAHHYIDASSQNTVEELNKLGGANLIVATAGNPKIVSPLVDALAPLGKLLVLARTFCQTMVGALSADGIIVALGPLEVNTVTMIMKG